MLPIPSGEAVTLNEDGSYTIFIDSGSAKKALHSCSNPYLQGRFLQA